MALDKKGSVWERNFAEDKQLAERVAAYFVPRIRVIRTNRLPLEEAWWRFFNMVNVIKDGYHGYQGRAQLYIPEVRKNVFAQARQLTRSAFPGDDCFDVSPGSTGTTDGAEAWRGMMDWAMRGCSLRQRYFIGMVQQCTYGTVPFYLPWTKIKRHQFRSRRGDRGKIETARREIEIFNGPDCLPRDIFRWYTFNPKRMDLRDGCFEINAASPGEVKRRAREGLVADVMRILDGGHNAYLNEEFSRDVMRAQSEGIVLQYNQGYSGEAVIERQDGRNEYADRTYMCTTIYADMVFPEACEDGEDPDVPIPMMVEIWGNDVCGLIQRNPYYHQMPPYVVGRYIAPNPDEFYGQGIPWATQYQQYEINVKAEQGMDSATLALNPVAIVNPGLAGASNEFEISPGAIWWADPTGVKFAEMPDVTPVAYNAISQLRAQIQDYSDRQPALPSQLMGKSRTATQSEIVNDSLSVDNWLFQMQNEENVIIPMLSQWECLIDQFMGDKQLVRIMGRHAGDIKRMLVTREDLLGRYEYVWKGASATANNQVKARQMLDALKVWLGAPPEMRQQYQFNFGIFFLTIWKDLWQLPNSDKILGIPEKQPSSEADGENQMVDDGMNIEVLSGDDDDAHMKSHDAWLEKTKNAAKKTIMMAHILEHGKQKQQKQMAAQAQQAQQAQQQQMVTLQMRVLAGKGDKLEAQAGKDGGQQTAPGSGNRTQLSPNGGTADIASGQRG